MIVLLAIAGVFLAANAIVTDGVESAVYVVGTNLLAGIAVIINKLERR
jgi:hypothetical protein